MTSATFRNELSALLTPQSAAPRGAARHPGAAWTVLRDGACTYSEGHYSGRATRTAGAATCVLKSTAVGTARRLRRRTSAAAFAFTQPHHTCSFTSPSKPFAPTRPSCRPTLRPLQSPATNPPPANVCRRRTSPTHSNPLLPTTSPPTFLVTPQTLNPHSPTMPPLLSSPLPSHPTAPCNSPIPDISTKLRNIPSYPTQTPPPS